MWFACSVGIWLDSLCECNWPVVCECGLPIVCEWGGGWPVVCEWGRPVD